MHRPGCLWREAGGEARGNHGRGVVADSAVSVGSVPVHVVPGLACRACRVAVDVVTALPPCAPDARCNACRQLATQRHPAYIGMWAGIRDCIHATRGHEAGPDEATRVCRPGHRCNGCGALRDHYLLDDDALGHWADYAAAYHAAYGHTPTTTRGESIR